MTHRRAVLLMIVVTLLWSIAGVVTRQLDNARSFEVTFWRSLFNAIALVLMLGVWRGPGALWRSVAAGRWPLWLSASCWAVMYTAFMIAITLTTVANVLVTMALAPLCTALIARLALGHRLAARTWAAIVMAGVGIGWMYAQGVQSAQSRHLLGTLVAVAVPVAAAVNWTVVQHINRAATRSDAPDMFTAVFLGAVISALITLPLALPFAATARDVGWLALLGAFQLAVPCLLAVAAAKALSAPEVSLLALLEVVFGVLWAWIGGGETPAPSVLGGGTLVLAALAFNEVAALRRAPGPA